MIELGIILIVLMGWQFAAAEYVGGILKLVEEKRGRQKNFEYVTPTRVMLTYELPLNEIVLDFYDRLKSVSRGYASLDYQLAGMWESPMVKLDILVSGGSDDHGKRAADGAMRLGAQPVPPDVLEALRERALALRPA